MNALLFDCVDSISPLKFSYVTLGGIRMCSRYTYRYLHKVKIDGSKLL